MYVSKEKNSQRNTLNLQKEETTLYRPKLSDLKDHLVLDQIMQMP